MGWDVVQIGLRHNLPIDDPFEMANEVAKRMNRNIRLVCWNDFELDKSNNIVRHDFDYDLIELGEIKVNNSSDYLQMMDSNYKAKQIADTLGFEKVRKLSQYCGSAKSLLRDLDYHRYDIEDEELQISVYNENVDLDVFVVGRWNAWRNAFHPINMLDECTEWLRNYRMQIYERARLFGCNEVIICSDQGPTEQIYNNLELSADDLLKYARSRQYMKNESWQTTSDKERWEKHAKQITFASFFRNETKLDDEDFVEVVYDDFSDIINSHKS
jgi:hypothetical protein